MPSDPSAPPMRAAPINLRALPREMLPLAISVASASKARSLASGDISPLLSPKGGTRGLAPPSCTSHHGSKLRYQAHPPNGLSLYAMWLFLDANFREFF